MKPATGSSHAGTARARRRRGAKGAERPEGTEASHVAGVTGGAEPDAYSIGELATALALTTRAIRFYEHKGLITPSRKGANRVYSRRDRARLVLIIRGKNLGFTLEDIAEFLALYDADPSQLAQTRLLLGKVEAHIDDLQNKRADIERTLRDLREIRDLCMQHLKGAGR